MQPPTAGAQRTRSIRGSRRAWFRLNLMSHYHGWSDVAAIDQELSYMHEASGTYEHISDAGFERMLLFLTGGKVEQNAFDLAGRMGY